MPRTKARNLVDGPFLALPHTLIRHSNFSNLSGNAVKLLIQLGCKYNGGNNGDLCATWSVMKTEGWKSQATLYESLSELLHYGFIEKTRQGGQHAASLYALTWQKINNCKGKLDIKPTLSSSGKWKTEQPKYTRKYRCKKLEPELPKSKRCAIKTEAFSGQTLSY